MPAAISNNVSQKLSPSNWQFTQGVGLTTDGSSQQLYIGLPFNRTIIIRNISADTTFAFLSFEFQAQIDNGITLKGGDPNLVLPLPAGITLRVIALAGAEIRCQDIGGST